MLAGVLVGVAMMVAEPLRHRCGATIQIANASDLEQFGKYRQQLINMAWGGDHASPESNRYAWRVETPGEGILRIAMDTSNVKAAVRQAEEMAREFIAQARAANEAQWSRPSEGENFLQSYVKVLTDRLDDAQRQLDLAMSKLPAADPRPDKAGLMHRWQSVRGDFEAARTQLRQAAEEYKRLNQQGELTQAAVSDEDRQAALAADADLQQDIKELGTTLTELKRHMLNVWQQSSADLEQLGTVAAAGATQPSPTDDQATPSSMREACANIAKEMVEFRDGVTAFAGSWNAEFAAMQNDAADAEKSTLLDAYQRVKTLLNDFLFHTGNRLTAMRESVNQLSRDPSDDAKHHLRQSDAARAFAELQSAHHRFEFAAGALDTPGNFRLDSALRIARGLRRRVADRIHAIDERLHKEALARATQERNQSLTALDEILRKSRDASESTVDELVAIQDRLESASTSSDQFVAAVTNAELANHRLQLTRGDLDQVESQLRGLGEQRAKARRDAELQFVWAGVLQKNVNLTDRLSVAGVGASVTILAVLLGQIVLAKSLRAAE